MALALISVGFAQSPADRERATALDWRRVGNTSLELGLASVASGPVDRVWYSDDGSKLYAHTGFNQIFETADFEHWRVSPLQAVPQNPIGSIAQNSPEQSIKIRAAFGKPGRLYAAGQNAYRSDDGGVSWSNLTQHDRRSIIGDGLSDVAVSPREPDEFVVANEYGVWRTVDAGASWTGLNDTLPNFPAKKFLKSSDGRTIAVAIDDTGTEVDWVSGEKAAWQLNSSRASQAQILQRHQLGVTLGARVTALSMTADVYYAGSDDGRIWSSTDGGKTWSTAFKANETGPVVSIYSDPREPQYAVAAISGARSGILRTTNGGRFWEDLTENLPKTPVHGVAADRVSGAIYAATDQGVYLAYAGSAAPASWSLLKSGKTVDVFLGPDANQLYVAFEATGVFATIAPHRFRDPRVVSSGDFAVRAAAPGALLTVLGARVQAAQAGQSTALVLAANDTQSQIQIPFDVSGSSISLALNSMSGRILRDVTLQRVSPSIFVDPDGTPLLVDGESGVMIDASTPAKAGSRVQIFATGLGRVIPDWVAGQPAPAQDSPRVAAPVTVSLDGAEIPVTRAILAPGYVGFYLVEVQLPDVLNNGTSDLYIESEGRQSNHVRLFAQPQ